MGLKEDIERLSAREELAPDDWSVFLDFIAALRSGEVRAAERGSDGKWVTNAWVKQGILLGFQIGRLEQMSQECETLRFFDKDSYPLRPLSIEDGVRVVPGGSSIRDGAFVSKGVVMMPPSYVNVGAYVDESTMIDSHVLVGTCAQIGKRVHLSAGAQIGGVIEPVNANPVIVEDDVLVGGNTGLYEGVIVRERAVIASGVILTRSTPVYDAVNEKVYRWSEDMPLEIPADAVVVQGARRMKGSFAEDNGLSIYAPVIVKYRDAKTDVSTMLVDFLRS